MASQCKQSATLKRPSGSNYWGDAARLGKDVNGAF